MRNSKLFRPSLSVLKQARKHLSLYSFAIEPDSEGGFIGYASELPGVIADGDTLDECARNLTFALETTIASYLADGQSPPAPAKKEKRTEQVNVRFTRSERNFLQRESAKQGFRGIGDFVRAEIMSKARI